jgi:uncharacterized protein DUF6788
MNKKLITKFESLKKELLDLGFLCVGSVSSVYRPCGKQNCRCQSDPEFRHGPYYQWTRKIKGKTVSRFLNEENAQECLAWIANQRKLEAIVKEMQDLSKEAAEWYR